MLTIYEVKELVKLLEQTDIESVEVKDEQARISIKRSLPGAQLVARVQTEPISSSKSPVAFPAVVAPAVTHAQTERAVVQESPRSTAEVAIDTQNHSANIQKIVSPMVGTFYAAPAVDAPPYVKVGDRVHASSVVCIVEAMKLFNEIEAEVSGEIVQVLVENGQLVEPGQPLFLVKLD
ncbi:acetyl-CoA carboxylase biotin carboxyl carrier protein [Brevibacillus panacihumi]|uniref:Biotin carboxyl carrier protein of acetyl-CoA carboxylase n=1 Tax=Brevibacillus panacihumi TaxID=497735 RepID=A0A3M8D2P7_9BACL|nr:acetyl-CoA carboxylase biotin carboxyl carrier protein [Brevibacillus panacihumi]RNB81851.1 acetyl-CoA carboxylase biotin carboxyl carrier protein [Brevibacillus panacihumi]